MKNNIYKFIKNSEKSAHRILVAGIMMILFAIPAGSFFNGFIRRVALNNIYYQNMSREYAAIEVTTPKEEQLKKEILKLNNAFRVGFIALAQGTQILIIVWMTTGGILFINKYFLCRKYIRVIKEIIQE